MTFPDRSFDFTPDSCAYCDDYALQLEILVGMCLLYASLAQPLIVAAVYRVLRDHSIKIEDHYLYCPNKPAWVAEALKILARRAAAASEARARMMRAGHSEQRFAARGPRLDAGSFDGQLEDLEAHPHPDPYTKASASPGLRNFNRTYRIADLLATKRTRNQRPTD